MTETTTDVRAAAPTPSDELSVCMLSVHTCPLAMLGGKETGGMNVYVRDLATELGRRGVSVDVFTRSQDEHVPRVSHELGAHAQVVHVPAGPEVPVTKQVIYDHLDDFAAGVRRFAAERGRRYDVIHSHYWLSGMAGERLQTAWPDTPMVQMFHTLGHMKNQVARAAHEVADDLRLTSETELMRHADRLVAGSPLDREQMIKLYGAAPGKIEVIPPGVDLTRFRPQSQLAMRLKLGLDPERRLILFVGRIEPLKGIDTLLEAIVTLDRDTADCHVDCGCLSVAIVGGDASVPEEKMTAEMQRLVRLRKRLGIEKLVTFLGKRDQDTLPDYYAAADMVVMPSHYESFGMVALEAMACGTPVVASRVGGLVHTIRDGETGLLVPGRDPHLLAQAIHRILQRDDLRWRLQDNAIQAAQAYGWPLIADRLVDLYRTVIRERQAAHPPTR